MLEAFEKKHLVKYSWNVSIKFSSEKTFKTQQTVSIITKMLLHILTQFKNSNLISLTEEE